MPEEKLITVKVNGIDVLVPTEQAIQINAAKTAEMFGQVNSTLEKITNSLEKLSVAVNAKNEDDEEKSDSADDETKEDLSANKKNADEDGKKENAKNADDEDEDKKEDAKNSDDQDQVVATKPDAVNSQRLSELMGQVINNGQQGNNSFLLSDCENSENVYTPDFIINNSERFDQHTLLAAFRNKFCAY